MVNFGRFGAESGKMFGGKSIKFKFGILANSNGQPTASTALHFAVANRSGRIRVTKQIT